MTPSRAPLRRTRRDLVATGVIAAVAAVAVGGAWFTAPVRSAHLETATDPAAATAVVDIVPAQLSEAFEAEASALPGVHRPVIAGGLTIANDSQTVRALDETGEEVWSYQRTDREICSLGQAWDKVVITYRSGVGCGDVVALDAATGQYSATRSAITDDSPVAISSNDRVGVVGPTRVELWRSDLVRTVEYGEIEAKQEPNLQPYEECDITSALTRTELLAVTETCPGEPEAPDTTMLRLQEATPEESRAPELHASVEVPSADAHLVAIGQESAAVYVPGSSPAVVSYDLTGSEIARSPVESVESAESVRSGSDAPGPVSPATADLPHHMSWHAGDQLHLLAPDTLQVVLTVEGALGTGAAVGDRLLAPVADGIAVVDWETGTTEQVIPVDRGGHAGEVHLEKAGGVLVEKRGDTLVALRPIED